MSRGAASSRPRTPPLGVTPVPRVPVVFPWGSPPEEWGGVPRAFHVSPRDVTGWKISGTAHNSDRFSFARIASHRFRRVLPPSVASGLTRSRTYALGVLRLLVRRLGLPSLLPSPPTAPPPARCPAYQTDKAHGWRRPDGPPAARTNMCSYDVRLRRAPLPWKHIFVGNH